MTVLTKLEIQDIPKLDLLKGFWQISLTERAKEISAFVTPDGLYHYKVMPFGMKNSPATFQRLINTITAGLEHCEAYIDNAIIYNDEWNHLGTIKAFFDKLREAKLTINLAKSEFCHATLTFLGHVVGHGQVKPTEAKVEEAISNFPVPTCKRQLMRFLGMSGYYRKFCNIFSVIAEPLTNLLSKRMRFKWISDCQNAFIKLKAILRSEPVLLAPNFNKEFKLAVDACWCGWCIAARG